MRLPHLFIAAAAMAMPLNAWADGKTVEVSKGEKFEYKTVLRPEGTTVLLFIQDTSAMEREFLADLEKELDGTTRVQLDLVRLKDTTAEAAAQYEVKETPTAIIYDRFGNVIAKTSKADEIKAAVRKGRLMARIKWIDEDDPKAAETYRMPAEMIKRGIPGIVKTAGLRPEVYQMFNIMSQVHFSDGFLKRREHEMVAAYVSGLNRCKF